MAENEKRDNENQEQRETREVFIRNVIYQDFKRMTKVYEYIEKEIPLHILFQEVLGCPDHDKVYMYIERLYRFRDKGYTKNKPTYTDLDDSLTATLKLVDKNGFGKFRDLAHRESVFIEFVQKHYDHIRRDVMNLPDKNEEQDEKQEE